MTMATNYYEPFLLTHLLLELLMKSNQCRMNVVSSVMQICGKIIPYRRSLNPVVIVSFSLSIKMCKYLAYTRVVTSSERYKNYCICLLHPVLV